MAMVNWLFVNRSHICGCKLFNRSIDLRFAQNLNCIRSYLHFSVQSLNLLFTIFSINLHREFVREVGLQLIASRGFLPGLRRGIMQAFLYSCSSMLFEFRTLLNKVTMPVLELRFRCFIISTCTKSTSGADYFVCFSAFDKSVFK